MANFCCDEMMMGVLYTGDWDAKYWTRCRRLSAQYMISIHVLRVERYFASQKQGFGVGRWINKCS